MKKIALVFVVVLMIFAMAAPAFAGQPSKGPDNASGRNVDNPP